MRNSAKEHTPFILPRLVSLVFVLLLQPFSLSGDQQFDITSEDMVAIHADQAWEDIEPGKVHFSGHFEMRVRDLVLSSDRATLFGELDDPDRLVLEGSPTRFSLSHTLGDRTEAVQAEAREIVYDRETGLMTLNGSARLAQGENFLLSERIEYDIKADRFRTSSETGLEINVRPQQ
jgi:lipopolysaccharide transport protein LptA